MGVAIPHGGWLQVYLHRDCSMKKLTVAPNEEGPTNREEVPSCVSTSAFVVVSMPAILKIWTPVRATCCQFHV